MVLSIGGSSLERAVEPEHEAAFCFANRKDKDVLGFT